MAYIIGVLAANPLLLQAAEKAEKSTKATGFASWGMWVLIAVMIGVFYFLLIRPQRKKAQQHDSMVSELRKGDEVVTIGGIHGVIKRLGDDKVVIEVDKGVRMTFARSAISRSVTEHEEEEAEEEEAEEEYEEEAEEYEEEYEEEAEEENEEEYEEEAEEENEE